MGKPLGTRKLVSFLFDKPFLVREILLVLATEHISVLKVIFHYILYFVNNLVIGVVVLCSFYPHLCFTLRICTFRGVMW
jgi:hypothetical protein